MAGRASSAASRGRTVGYVALFAAAAAVIVWWQWPQRPASPIEQMRIEAAARDLERGDRPARSIAEAWRWEQPEASAAADSADAIDAPDRDHPFDVVVVYQALSQVELDDDGDIVLDSNALRALESSFAALAPELSVTEIAQLQEIIRQGLPGGAGERTAQIVGDYYRYRIAETDFRATRGEPEGIDATLEQFEQVVELRRLTLGPDVAEQLYGMEQAHMRYTLESMRIQSDTSLSDEERATAQARLMGNMPVGLVSDDPDEATMTAPVDERLREMRAQGATEGEIRQARERYLGAEPAARIVEAEAEEQAWQQRYQAFDEERRAVMREALGDEERQARIDALFEEHYADEVEREAARAYDEAQQGP